MAGVENASRFSTLRKARGLGWITEKTKAPRRRLCTVCDSAVAGFSELVAEADHIDEGINIDVDFDLA